MKRYICILYFFMGAMFIYCQNEADEGDEKNEKIDIAGSANVYGIIGGEFANDNMVFESGMGVTATCYIHPAKRIYYGLGAGFEKLDTESFVPIFLEFKGLLKKKKDSPFLHMQMGYAIGNDTDFNDYKDYSFKGGMFFSTGAGKLIPLNDKSSFALSISLKHQFSKIDYLLYEKTYYSELVSFDLLLFKLTYIFE